ncbi:MAG: hypothetical protein KC503_31470 [Myxococcales bacterium]|nr:hypothetical protein [Myxococcales bacterium]
MGHGTRLALLALALAATATCDAFDDRQRLLAERAGEGAEACGFADQYAGTDAPAPGAVSACVLAALSSGRARFETCAAIEVDGGCTSDYDALCLRCVTPQK